MKNERISEEESYFEMGLKIAGIHFDVKTLKKIYRIALLVNDKRDLANMRDVCKIMADVNSESEVRS